jgi:transposase
VVEVIDGLDLSELEKAYRGSGSASYHPAMLLALLVYGYATRVFSSRAIERATHDSVAFRFIAGNEHPDHDTIATFRKRFLPQIQALFVEVLKLARTMGMLKLGTVALDGTKVHANASRHSALSYGHAKKIEKQLKKEVQQLLRLAEQADGVNTPDGMSIPEELERRELRLARSPRRKRRSRNGPRSAWSVSRPSIRANWPHAPSRKSALARSRVAAHRRGERQGPGEPDGRRLAHHESPRRGL